MGASNAKPEAMEADPMWTPGPTTAPQEGPSEVFAGSSSDDPYANRSAATIPASQDPGDVPVMQIPHHFKWVSGGTEVFLTGTFNGWREKIPMPKQGENTFATVLALPPGYYEYKFIVDNQWKFATDQPTTSDPVGNINNFVEIIAMRQVDSDSEMSETSSTPAVDEYGQFSCEADEFVKEPPPLPPHFRYKYLPLNQQHVSGEGGMIPTPSHVLLNHALFGSRIITTATINSPNSGSDTFRAAMSHRFRGKFVTTILYKPMPQRQIQLQLYAHQQQQQQQQHPSQ